MGRIKKQPPGLSDATLYALWRKAVLHVWGNQCHICGGVGSLEVHHLVHRRYKLLRWDWRNGIPVCSGDCHEIANLYGIKETGETNAKYLEETARLTFKQYLADKGLSETEWRQTVKADLLAAIGGNA